MECKSRRNAQLHINTPRILIHIIFYGPYRLIIEQKRTQRACFLLLLPLPSFPNIPISVGCGPRKTLCVVATYELEATGSGG